MSDLTTIQGFDNLIKIIIFYHFNRCAENKCHYCSFLGGLYIIYSELKKEENDDISRLRFYFIMRKEIFISAKIYIYKPAEIEKKDYY